MEDESADVPAITSVIKILSIIMCSICSSNEYRL